MHAAICASTFLLTSEACVLQVLWQALKSGGIYVVEDLSENYIEKPFLDKGTFTNFMKTAIDTVQCRCLPPPAPAFWYLRPRLTLHHRMAVSVSVTFSANAKPVKEQVRCMRPSRPAPELVASERHC